MKPEARAKKMILLRLRALCKASHADLYIQSQAGSQFGTVGVDMFGSIRPHDANIGVPFAVEAKRFDVPRHITPRQRATLANMNMAGVETFEVKNEEELAVFLDWVRAIC